MKWENIQEEFTRFFFLLKHFFLVIVCLVYFKQVRARVRASQLLTREIFFRPVFDEQINVKKENVLLMGMVGIVLV